MFGPVQTCRVCGCTDNDCRQCIEKTGGPCWWVQPDLCSACYDELTTAATNDAVAMGEGFAEKVAAFRSIADWVESEFGERPQSMTVSFTKDFPEYNQDDFIHYLEDGVLYYALGFNPDFYKELSIHQRINFKFSYYALSATDEELQHMPLRIYTYESMWRNDENSK